MRLKWLGHASWKLLIGEKIIYIDPYQGQYDEEADIILSTHSHTDHCDPSKVNMVKGNDTVIVAPADCAEKIGSPVKSLKPGEKITSVRLKSKLLRLTILKDSDLLECLFTQRVWELVILSKLMEKRSIM